MSAPVLRSQEACWFLDFYRSIETPEHKIPRKSALTPESLLPVLGHVFIVEALPSGYFFRLFGSDIARIVGRDHTKHHLTDMIEGDDLKHIQAILARCLSTPVIIATKERIVYPDRDWIEVEILRCPFADRHGAARFIAGTFSETGVISQNSGPKVLGTQEIEIQRSVGTDFDIPLDGATKRP